MGGKYPVRTRRCIKFSYICSATYPMKNDAEKLLNQAFSTEIEVGNI